MVLLDNTSNQPAKFRTKNCIEIKDDVHGTYNTNSQFKFKVLMPKSSFCDYCDASILVSGTITVAVLCGGNNGKNVIFKNCSSFTEKSEISNVQVDNAEDVDIVMAIYNLKEYSESCLNTFVSL